MQSTSDRFARHSSRHRRGVLTDPAEQFMDPEEEEEKKQWHLEAMKEIGVIEDSSVKSLSESDFEEDFSSASFANSKTRDLLSALSNGFVYTFKDLKDSGKLEDPGLKGVSASVVKKIMN